MGGGKYVVSQAEVFGEALCVEVIVWPWVTDLVNNRDAMLLRLLAPCVHLSDFGNGKNPELRW